MEGVSTPIPKYIVFRRTRKKCRDLVRSSAANLMSSLNILVDVQHEMLKMIAGQYPPPVHDIMVDDIPGETKAILDLGCGSGSW
jgi:hypothetical protein